MVPHLQTTVDLVLAYIEDPADPELNPADFRAAITDLEDDAELAPFDMRTLLNYQIATLKEINEALMTGDEATLEFRDEFRSSGMELGGMCLQYAD